MYNHGSWLFPIGVRNGASAGQEHQIYVAGILRKWDGTTETEIARVSGAVWVNTGMGANTTKTSTSGFTLDIPVTKLKKGETIRYTIELHAESGGAVGVKYWFGADPKNRATSTIDTAESIDFGTTPSQALLNLPFRISD